MTHSGAHSGALSATLSVAVSGALSGAVSGTLLGAVSGAVSGASGRKPAGVGDRLRLALRRRILSSGIAFSLRSSSANTDIGDAQFLGATRGRAVLGIACLGA